MDVSVGNSEPMKMFDGGRKFADDVHFFCVIDYGLRPGYSVDDIRHQIQTGRFGCETVLKDPGQIYWVDGRKFIHPMQERQHPETDDWVVSLAADVQPGFDHLATRQINFLVGSLPQKFAVFPILARVIDRTAVGIQFAFIEGRGEVLLGFRAQLRH
jgi:hypothetical protein